MLVASSFVAPRASTVTFTTGATVRELVPPGRVAAAAPRVAKEATGAARAPFMPLRPPAPSLSPMDADHDGTLHDVLYLPEVVFGEIELGGWGGTLDVVRPPRAVLGATTHPYPKSPKPLQIEGRRVYSGSMGVGSKESGGGERGSEGAEGGAG